MLIRFSCKNFRSIGTEPLKFEMVSSSKIQALPEHVCDSKDGAKILRNGVIYGGNASGKSSLIKAFLFLDAAVSGGGIPVGTSKEFCRAGAGHADEESVFDIQFSMEGKVFDYGFSCVLSRFAVTSEWLVDLNGSPKTLFSREGNTIEVGKQLNSRLSEDERARMRIYSEDFLGSDFGEHSLFLPFIGRGKAIAPNSSLQDLVKAFAWFGDGIDIMLPGQSPSKTEFYNDGSTLDSVAEVLSSLDTGILSLKKIPVPFEDLEKRIPSALVVAVKDILRSNPPKNDDDKLVMTLRNENVFIGIERDGLDEPVATTLEIGHSGSSLTFDFGDESDGTKRLFDFMDILFTKRCDTVFVVDELDRSLHPMLTAQIVKLFTDAHADDRCQLVFTTHENDIMTDELFRRDEIWFVDRSEDGTSVLYPLDSFNLRSDARIGKQYLEGRYGGVPVLSTTKALSAIEEGR